ncbi:MULTISPECIES: hypothetical protein [unclassified Phaeobacter]|uniref:hypothetical protein n=1 Tax=unclassified Phaeobacter TaxID=2621772 RepID=UPI003A858A83
MTDTSKEAVARMVYDVMGDSHYRGKCADLLRALESERDALRAQLQAARDAALEEAAAKMDNASANAIRMSESVTGVEKRDLQTSGISHSYAAQAIRALKSTSAEGDG